MVAREFDYQVRKLAIIGCMILAYTASYASMSTLSVAAPMLIVEYDYDNSDIGLILTIATALRVVPKFTTGLLVDLIGGKGSLIISTFLISICTIAIPFYPTLWWIGVMWTLIRVIQSLVWPGIVKIVARWCPTKEMGKAFSILDFGYWFSLAFLQIIVMVTTNWKMLFYASGAFGIIVCVLMVVILKETPLEIHYPEPPGEVTIDSTSWKEKFKAIYLNPKFWCLAAYYGGTTIIRQAIWDWILLFLTQTTGCSVQYSVMVFSSFAFVGTLSTLMFGIISDKTSHLRRDIICAIFGMLLIVCLLLITLFIPAGGFSPDWFHILIYSLLLISSGFFLSGPWSLPAAVMALSFGGKQLCGTVSGNLDGLATLASLLTGLIGVISELPNGWRMVFGLLGITAIFSILFFIGFIFLDNGEEKKYQPTNSVELCEIEAQDTQHEQQKAEI